MRMLIDKLKRIKTRELEKKQSEEKQDQEETYESEPESPSVKPTKLDVVLKRARYLKYLDQQKAAEEKERLENEIKKAERRVIELKRKRERIFKSD